MINLDKRDLDSLVKKLAKMGPAANAPIDNSLKKSAAEVRSAYAAETPVGETGDLQAAVQVGEIRESRGRRSIVIGPEKGNVYAAHYGRFVEYGTVKLKKKPFASVVFARIKSRVENDIIKDIGDAIEKAFLEGW